MTEIVALYGKKKHKVTLLWICLKIINETIKTPNTTQMESALRNNDPRH